MPVDEANLETKKAALLQKLRDNNTSSRAVKSVLENIEKIEMIQDPTFPDDPSKKVEPEDRGLGQKINPARRQSIYDKVLTDTTALGL